MEKVTTTIRIPKNTKEKLEWLKHYYGIGSVSDIINILICKAYQQVNLNEPEPLPTDLFDYLIKEVHWKDN